MEGVLSVDRANSSLTLLVSLLKECDASVHLLIEIAERAMQAFLENPSDAGQGLIQNVVGRLVLITPLPNDNYWFGGSTKCKTGSGIRDKWSNALLIGCSLVQDPDPKVLNAVAKLYNSSAEFADRMASQDDRLISSVLTLFLLKDSFSFHSKLNHRIVCGHVFAAIEFNYEVRFLFAITKVQTLIDWLNSEALFARFFVVFLDDLLSNIDIWKESFLEVQRQREDEATMSFMPGTWVEIEQETMDGAEEKLELSFVEMAGTQLVQKDMSIRKSEPPRTFISYTVEISEEPYFSRLYDMLVRLRLRLEAISSKNLGNYGAIVKQIEKFEELVDEEMSE